MIKLRLLDPTGTLLPGCLSAVGNWVECFFYETRLPVQLREDVVSQLSTLWEHGIMLGDRRLNFDRLLLVADNKQLCFLCGIQGGSTSQRCSICTLTAEHFFVDSFGGCVRDMDVTAQVGLLGSSPGYSVREWSFRFPPLGGQNVTSKRLKDTNIWVFGNGG